MDNQQEGIVIDVHGNMAKVKTSRHNDCDNCGACPGNSAIILDALNPVDAKRGQLVVIEIQQINMLKAAFIVYMLPLVAVFIGAVAGGAAAEYWAFPIAGSRIIGGLAAFLLAVGYIRYFDYSARSDDKMQPVIVKVLS